MGAETEPDSQRQRARRRRVGLTIRSRPSSGVPGGRSREPSPQPHTSRAPTSAGRRRPPSPHGDPLAAPRRARSGDPCGRSSMPSASPPTPMQAEMRSSPTSARSRHSRTPFAAEPGQCGAVLGIGDELCLDVVSRPQAFAVLWPKLRAGYLLDALGHLDGRRRAPSASSRSSTRSPMLRPAAGWRPRASAPICGYAGRCSAPGSSTTS